MAFDFLITARESSYLPGNVPTADNIYNAMQGVSLPEGTNWLGPLPKIVRRQEVGFKKFVTYVGWPIEIQALNTPDGTPQGAQQVADQVAASVTTALRPMSEDWEAATAVPYENADTATYGTLASWQAGKASVPTSSTSDTSLAENIANDEQVYIQKTGDVLSSATSSLAKITWIKPAAYVLAGGVVLFLVWPVIAGARRNPAPKRKRSRSKRSRVNVG